MPLRGHVDQQGYGSNTQTGGHSAPPPVTPELNSMEPTLKYLRANIFASQFWDSYEEIEQAVMDVWNRYASNPGQIASITGTDWM